MKANLKLALIATPPGPLRDGLKALLATIPQIEHIESIGDASSLAQLVAERRPSLVVLDFSLVASEIATLLRQTEARSPATQYILLVNNVDEQQKAALAHAGTIFLKGVSPIELFSTVEKMLAFDGGENSAN
jgi:DNA-binding NarL/FixJ family response regulator